MKGGTNYVPLQREFIRHITDDEKNSTRGNDSDCKKVSYIANHSFTRASR